MFCRTGEVSNRMLERQMQSIRNTIHDINSKTRDLRSVERGHQRSHDDLCTLNSHSNLSMCRRIPTQTLRVNPRDHQKSNFRLDPYDKHVSRNSTSDPGNVKVTRSKSLPPIKTYARSSSKPLGSPNVPGGDVIRSYPYTGIKQPPVNQSIVANQMMERLTHNTPIPDGSSSLLHPRNHLPSLKEDHHKSLDDVTQLPSMNRRRTIRRADVIHQSLKVLYQHRRNYEKSHPRK